MAREVPGDVTIDDVLARAAVDMNSGCWLWERGTQKHGYGCWSFGPFSKLAHRVAFEARHGPIPSGMFVCHRCDTTACVNPDHLFLGSQKDNMSDCARKGRIRLPGLRGEAHHQAKLTEADVRVIRADPRSLRSISIAYGITKSTASYIRLRRTWKHVA